MIAITPDRLASQIGPRHLAIADLIAADIAEGRLAAATRLPPQRDLAHELGCGIGTVTRAYGELTRRRLVDGQVGRGTYVRGPRAEEAAPGFVDLTESAPCLGPQEQALADTLAALGRESEQLDLLRYPPTSGLPAHREAGSRWIARLGVEAPARELLVAAGAQQALAAALAALGREGRPVLVEAVTYPGLLRAARVLGVPVRGVALDDEGMRPEALDRAAAETGAAAVFLVPTLQNPTNAVMSPARRGDIVEVARRRDLAIVEDDVYGHVLPGRPAPLKSLAPERTIHITGISKSLAGGPRVAWLWAPSDLLDRLADALYAFTVTRPALTLEVARRWIESDTAERLIAWQRTEIQARHALLREALGDWPLASHPFAFHALLDLPSEWRPESFVAAAAAQGTALLAMGAFETAEAPPRRAVRISHSNAPGRQALQHALARLRRLLEEGPGTGGILV